MVPAALKAGSDLAYGLPPLYRLCLSLSIPAPFICHKNNKISPLYFYFPFIIVSLPPFIVFVRLTYLVNLAYSQPLKSYLEGNRES